MPFGNEFNPTDTRFDFTCKEFLVDSRVTMMSMAQRGLCMTLMAFCAVEGFIADDEEGWRRVTRLSEREWSELWPEVRNWFFEPDPNDSTRLILRDCQWVENVRHFDTMEEYRQRNARDSQHAASMRRSSRVDAARRRGTHSEADWLAICAAAHNKCLACGQRKKLTKDHVIPVTKDGSDGADNLQPLCQRCNSKKGTKTTDYRPADWAERLMEART